MQTDLEKRKLLLKRYAQSGLSAKAFCKAENISTYTLWYWQKKLTDTKKPAGFIRLKSNKAIKASVTDCEITFVNGNRVKFSCWPDAFYLKQLMA